MTIGPNPLRRCRLVALLLVAILLSGTVGYRLIEGWDTIVFAGEGGSPERHGVGRSKEDHGMSALRRVSAIGFGVAVAVGGLLAGGVGVSAAGITVHAGQSIQAAVDKAHPGDTITVGPGVYHQTVLIRKDGITLRAADPDDHNTILLPPASSNDFCTQINGALSGVCVVAKSVDNQGNVITPVRNVTIDGLVVDNFSAFGVFGFGVDGYTVRNVHANNDGDYGMVGFSSTRVTFRGNQASGAGEAGIYLGDSPDADATIADNVSWNNQFGIFVRHSHEGEVTGNTVKANCVGLMVLDDGQPGGVGNLSIHDNRSLGNNKVCPATTGPEGHPALSGTGILLVGATSSTIGHNTVTGNSSNQSPVSGGIVLISAQPLDGGLAPSNDRFDDNHASKNAPADLVYDKSGTGIVFLENDCTSSQPTGLCEA